MKRVVIILSAMLLVLLTACSEKPQEDVILKVGDREVTLDEFRYRSEFTPHPNFPKHDHALEKIFLNNLIMEKVFSQEAGKDCELRQSEQFQSYVAGVKEQEMRKQLYWEEFYNSVELDSTEVSKTYRLARREYDVEFYTINNENIAKRIQTEILTRPDSATKIFNSIWRSANRPTKSVKYRDPDHINIHEALFSEALDVGQVIGPLKVGDNQWILMKVADWSQTVDFGGEASAIYLQQVKEKMTENKALRGWNSFLRELMVGKKIDFNRDTFLKLADMTFELEHAENPDEKGAIMEKFWNEEDSTLTAADLPTEEAFMGAPFFTIDGETWTVGDFRREVGKHPLVYREETQSKNEFYNQFRMAIADLIRDHYITEHAYEQGLDEHPEVERVGVMWEDALVGTWYREKMLKEIAAQMDADTSEAGYSYKLGQEFEAYMQGLREKHHDNIKVNWDLFNDVEIMSTNLFVMQPQSAYPVVVPSWPLYTNHRGTDFQALQD